MSEDVFRVTMVVGRGEAAVAELEGTAAGEVFPVGDPVVVSAGVLARVAGVPVSGLPGLGFVPSGGGWRLVGFEAVG